jgi:benzodiazapine receptor|tara:strand:- start:175 stop:600 length:426 start_codon:yes stop_codon:yes gene_type:complete
MKQEDLMRLVYPMVAGFGVSLFCKMGKSGTNVKFRPPPYIFGIVWPILYLLLGLSWIHSNPQQNQLVDGLFFTLSSLLAFWIVVYACQKDKKNAVFVMVAILLAIALLMVLIPQKSQLMLTPLGIWILFALFLSTADVQNS